MSVELDDFEIIIRKGNDFREPFDCADKNGMPINLSGWGIKAQLRAKKKLTATLLADFVIDRSEEATGRIYLVLPLATSAALPGRKGYYDILFTNPDDFSETYVEGKARLDQTVTVK